MAHAQPLPPKLTATSVTWRCSVELGYINLLKHIHPVLPVTTRGYTMLFLNRNTTFLSAPELRTRSDFDTRLSISNDQEFCVGYRFGASSSLIIRQLSSTHLHSSPFTFLLFSPFSLSAIQYLPTADCGFRFVMVLHSQFYNADRCPEGHVYTIINIQLIQTTRSNSWSCFSRFPYTGIKPGT